MKPIAPHLADEHMNLYEWNGGTAQFGLPAETPRAARWHLPFGVLAVLTSLLVLNGCDRQGPAEAAGEKIDQTLEETRDQAADLYEEVSPQDPSPAERAGDAIDDAREAAGEKIEEAGEALKP
ncbi:MAG: hypothetical protein B7Y26_02820 [Hydrogenophilales bacterium 16-64-46]|nr:MAG: hypothetical protein B7Z32_02520 [Hydrogenophilales bacterium 12-64-13]OYZ06745.1 MAG: hypothetical protein B7Y26_02820 [Hydrogenophilales bacterium 16-64-46]OZA39453.1 MAG: hypothetical protein B7X87_03925 [Hydrogenophilales bacterium 17-64-34]HQT01213.1 hypothetical protein [Thiobacillus sp.]